MGGWHVRAQHRSQQEIREAEKGAGVEWMLHERRREDRSRRRFGTKQSGKSEGPRTLPKSVFVGWQS